jgi:hypothetical protein
MAKFTRIAKPSPLGADEVFLGADRKNPAVGERFLLVELLLIDPKTSQQDGSLTAHLTVMKPGGTLLFGYAEHNFGKGDTISVQGSPRPGDARTLTWR